MLALEVCKKTIKFKKVNSFKCEILRFLSTKEAVINTQNVERRYSKPVSNRNLKPLNAHFLRDLFCDSVDKKIFQYPSILRSEEIGIVLSQTSEVEKFLSNNENIKLTEEVVAKLKELELFGLSVPKEYGGAGYTHTEAKFLLECTGINPTLARFLGYQDLGCKLLELYGSEKQKDEYLTRLASGKSFLSLAYLENGPLIDLSKFEGSALLVEDKKQFILNGEKKWVHNADRADLFLVMLKSSLFDTAADKIKLQFNMFIVDRKTPGVTVHKSVHKNIQDYDLYDVSFNKVTVPVENVLGSIETDGFKALKCSISHNNLTDAVLCCCLIKCIIHYVSQSVHEKDLIDTTIRGNGLHQENLAFLCANVFGLESVIYLLTGWYDMYKDPDLFDESVLVKALAIDTLQTAVKNYVGTVGRESLKSPGILEEALKALQFYSVFEENIEYLKMMVAADGIVQAAHSLSNRVKILRKPYENVLEGIKWSFTTEKQHIKKWKSKHNFKMELPSELTETADTLEVNCAKFQSTIENLFTEYGSLLMQNENFITKFADIAAYLFATMASLSRASNSICYNLEGCENDLQMAVAFGSIADTKINSFLNEDMCHSGLINYYRVLGKMILNRKEYPVEHPLARTY